MVNPPEMADQDSPSRMVQPGKTLNKMHVDFLEKSNPLRNALTAKLQTDSSLQQDFLLTEVRYICNLATGAALFDGLV